MINIAAMEQAAQDLDAGAFKLWCYFSKNQNKYQFALSSAEVNNNFGIKIKQYNNAINELIEKEYLKPVSNNSNIFDFYEVSLTAQERNSNFSVVPFCNNAVVTKSNNCAEF